MFSFLSPKKEILNTGILTGMTDVHCHLLPGVDDGVANLEEARRALDLMERIGVARVFLTPHVMEDMPDNRPEFLRERLAWFKEQVQTPIQFKLAAEYMLDNAFAERRKDGLLTLGSNHVLVETSYLSAPYDMEDTLYDLQAEGYQPVLAHAERYMYMEQEDYDRLQEHGIVFQLNLMSLAGTYGQLPYEKAVSMLEKGYYRFVGSDYHRRSVYEKSLEHLRLKKKQIQQLGELLANNLNLWNM